MTKFFLSIILVSLTIFKKILGETCNITNCIQCSSNNNSCDKCKEDFIYSSELHTCMQKSSCPIGKFLKQRGYSRGTCQDCQSSCKVCFGRRDHQCLHCNDGYFPDFYEFYVQVL